MFKVVRSVMSAYHRFILALFHTWADVENSRYDPAYSSNDSNLSISILLTVARLFLVKCSGI